MYMDLIGYVYVDVDRFTCMHACIRMYAWKYVRVHLRTHVNKYFYAHAHTHVNIHIYIYVYRHTYIYM